ncbi:4'-phosphopantetheinyl transferase superfamily protein [Brucella sp. NBRC 12950]|uniref:4'-phosphopantetheinyl transferase family protein n=1 Tax=Brucella sp. NBRC 12950 TaxID=2994518 RepID=UPI0024A190E5|nr:4'-phosphopantetheinyl transferase superfamily protein [Brucella sp. NBRC 12950]GLU29349.1 4'-phosphopantetheinyl transferase [Brucella sp. NBRC 12950]
MLLKPEEKSSLPANNTKRLDASGAARELSRQILAKIGFNNFSVLRSPTGEPLWPNGVVGSLAHDDEMAVAVIGRSKDYLGLGIDIETAVPLPDDIISLVRTPEDICGQYDSSALADRILFCVKEAVYKAVYPLDRIILNYDDICVDLSEGIAYTATRKINLNIFVASKVTVVAALPLG